MEQQQLHEKYRQQVANVPILTSGKFCNKIDGALSLTYTQDDLDSNSKCSFTKYFPNGLESSSLLFHNDAASSTLFSLDSPSRTYKLRIKSIEKKKQCIEIWSPSSRISTYKSSNFKILLDGFFQGIQWSPCEQFIYFIAQPVESPTTSYSWDEKDVDYVKPVKTGDWIHNDWGEKQTDVSSPQVFRYNISLQSVEQITKDDMSFGQLSVNSDNTEVVVVGWSSSEGRRLGVYGVTNRASALYTVITPSQIQKIDLPSDDLAVRCPRYSPDGTLIAFLSSKDHHSHDSCAALCVYNVETKSTTTLVDVVETTGKDDDFPGIYCACLSPSVSLWTPDGKSIILPTQWGATQAIICVDVATKSVTRIHENSVDSMSLLDISLDSKSILVAKSSPFKPPTAEVLSIINNISTSSLQGGVEIIKTVCDGGCEMQSILLLPSDDNDSNNLHVMVHGGPHACYSTSYNALTSFLVSHCNTAVLLVNYRGSTGHGQASLSSVSGNIGKNDVKDVVSIVKEVVKLKGFKVLSVSGGSHGGFLAAHLIGLYPTMFKTAVLRNPVLDTVTGSVTTDIPDWYSSCVLNTTDRGDMMTTSNLLQTASPLESAGNVEVPVLLAIGGSDKRVSPITSRRWFHKVNNNKRGGGTVSCLHYPTDGHALDSVKTKADFGIKMLVWLKKYHY